MSLSLSVQSVTRRCIYFISSVTLICFSYLFFYFWSIYPNFSLTSIVNMNSSNNGNVLKNNLGLLENKVLREKQPAGCPIFILGFVVGLLIWSPKWIENKLSVVELRSSKVCTMAEKVMKWSQSNSKLLFSSTGSVNPVSDCLLLLGFFCWGCF